MSDLSVEREGSVLVATIRSHDGRNAIAGTLFRDLLCAANEVEENDELGALVVAAEGPVWCSGGDPSLLSSGFGPGAHASRLVHRDKIGGDQGLNPISEQALAFESIGVGAWLLKYRECGKPLIAAIDGAAVGGGFALALAHDIRILGKSARFRAAFNSVGVGPEMAVSWTLPRLVGPSRAVQLIMQDSWILAPEAVRMGLASEVVADGTLHDHAVDVAQRISSRPGAEVRATVRLLREANERILRTQLELEWSLRRMGV